MLLAVLADVHANWPALRSVIAVAQERGAEGFVCLGDVVGYGAQPAECFDALCALGTTCIRGNHDDSMLGHDVPLTRALVSCTHHFAREALGRERIARLQQTPREHWFSWGSAVHGCWINPARVSGYVTVTTAMMNLGWLRERVTGPHVGLFGHTHVPIAHFADGRDHKLRAGQTLRLPKHEPVLLNPGAVGQPRDGDPRASFALLDLDALQVECVRVPYDIAESAAAQRAAGFDASFSDRLFVGE